MLDKLKNQITDLFIEKLVSIFPEVVLEANELRELVEKSAVAMLTVPASERVDTPAKGIADHLVETALQVHSEAFEDVSGSRAERLLCQWSLRALADQRAFALRIGNAKLVAEFEELFREMREGSWGAAFPDLFENFDWGR